MPSLPLRPCAEPGCSAIVARGYCRQHAQAKERARPLWDVRRLYRTARWTAIRRAQLASEPLCRDCHQRGRVTAATHVDHITPHRGDEQAFWASPVQSLCAACHSRKTAHGA